jgi:hypothetical protein
VKPDVRKSIEDRLHRAKTIIPTSVLPPLPITPELRGDPQWYPFEHQVWTLGEEIRQSIATMPRLRKDVALQMDILEVACDRRARRGRQSFILLLAHRAAAAHGTAIAGQLDDPGVAGHVIKALYLMRARGFISQVWPFLEDEKTWVRREARRYLAWEAGG